MESQTISEGSLNSGDDSFSSDTGGVSTTEQMLATLPPIVTNSLEEQVITAGLLLSIWLYVNLSNGSLLYVIRSEYSLHTPHYMVLAAYMLFDIFYCNIILVNMLTVVISNDIQVMTDVVSRAFATATGMFFSSSVHTIGLLSYERYCYFITPLTYTTTFTKTRIYTTLVLICLLAFCISLGVDLVEPRVPAATTMTYQATGRASQITNIVYAVLYAIPCCSVSVITLLRLRKLISKHKAQVQPSVMSEDQSAVNGVIVKPVKEALRMVGLVSGAFWFITIPGAFIRFGLSASGVTWAVTDYRLSMPLFVLSRGSYLMITVLTSLLNPIIYMAVLTDLRKAVCKCIGIQRNNSIDIVAN